MADDRMDKDYAGETLEEGVTQDELVGEQIPAAELEDFEREASNNG